MLRKDILSESAGEGSQVQNLRRLRSQSGASLCDLFIRAVPHRLIPVDIKCVSCSLCQTDDAMPY